MVMKLEAFKRLFHPAWDQPEDEVEVVFRCPAVNQYGATFVEMPMKETTFDVAKKLWIITLDIGKEFGSNKPEGEDYPPVEDGPLHSHGQAEPHSHDFGGAKHTHEDGVPVADEPSDT